MSLSVKRVLTVARREYRVTVARKSFILSIVGLPAYFAFIFWITALTHSSSSSHEMQAFRELAVVDSSGEFANGARRIHSEVELNPLDPKSRTRGFQTEVKFFPDLAAAMQAMRSGRASQVLLIPADYMARGHLRRYAHSTGLPTGKDESAIRGWLARGLLRGRLDSLRAERAMRPVANMELLEPDRQGRFVPQDDARQLVDFLLPMAVGMLLGMCIMSGGQYLLQGLAEEKESRILESMLCIVSPEELLAGKLLGLGGAGLTLVGTWLGAGMLTGGAALAALPVQLSAGLFACALAYFLLGYLYYASLMAGVAAAASNAREAQQLSVVLAIANFFPFFLLRVLLDRPNSSLAVGLSLFPPTAPVAMMLRMAAPGSGVPGWQVGLSLALLAAASWLTLRMAAKVFRIGMLTYGKTPNLAEVLRWVRAK
jgi:ABC-2 type transport system permease protein